MSNFKNLKIMSFSLGINGALGGVTQGASIGGLIPGIGAGLGGAIGGGLGLLGGLFGGGSNTKEQERLMEKAWEYEKEGMGIQYQYGQAAANAAQQRNLEMWNQTNFEAQRKHLENANLSVGLMYGGGGQSVSSQGGAATQPSGPTSNPVAMALQFQGIEQQNKQIEAQNRLMTAETAKTLAEAAKIAGPETTEANWTAKKAEIDFRIEQSVEQITASNITKAEAEAQTAVEQWNQAMMQTKLDSDTLATRTNMMITTLQNAKIDGILKIANISLTRKQVELIEKEIEGFYYKLVTERMSAEAAKGQADAAAKNVINTLNLGEKRLDLDKQKMIGEWVLGGAHEVISIIQALTGLKKAGAIIESIKKLREK